MEVSESSSFVKPTIGLLLFWIAQNSILIKPFFIYQVSYISEFRSMPAMGHMDSVGTFAAMVD